LAGFLDNGKQVFSAISDTFRKITSFGMSYGDMVIKNSQAVGTTEASFLAKGGIQDEAFLYGLRRADTTTKQYVSYYDKDHKSKRIYIQNFATNPEIEFIIDTVCDESIVYDDKNFWAYLSPFYSEYMEEEVSKKMQTRFKHIYSLFGFNNDILGWHYFRKFLIEGVLAFEIILDTTGKNIIGFKELDSITLLPTVEINPDGTTVDIWIQFPDNPSLSRKLYDSQIIYISYAKGNTVSRISYAERLIRSFNLLRIMEYTRLIWNVMNSSYRMTMTVPIGTKSPQKAKQTLGELMSIYKEDIRLDTDTGELVINGKPNIQFFKNYLIPSSPNGTTDIQPLAGSGDSTAFSDVKSLQYFQDKLKIDSKIPASRFNRDDSGSMGTFTSGADGLDQEEIRFGKFIGRLRSIFQEILMKPLWVQFCIDHPHLKDDWTIKSQLGLDFVKENMFVQAKYMETLTARKDQILKIAGVMKPDGTPLFSLRYLIDRYSGMTDNDRTANEEYKRRALEKKNKTEGEEKTTPEKAEGTKEAPAEVKGGTPEAESS